MTGAKALSLLATASWLAVAQQTNYSQFVNPFIGAEGPIPGYAYGGGDIFVGGAVPFGVVKLGIDTWYAKFSHSAHDFANSTCSFREDRVDIATPNGGYTPNGVVTGISMMHESGTGGCPKYGVISQMPLTSIASPINVLNETTYWQKRVGTDQATVGYFHTDLENGVGVSLAGARHAGILQYDFPASGERHVLVDVSHFLPDPVGGFCTQYYLDGSISISEDSRSYTGHGTYGGGFNLGAPYTGQHIRPRSAKYFIKSNLIKSLLLRRIRKHAFRSQNIHRPKYYSSRRWNTPTTKLWWQYRRGRNRG